MKMSDNPLFKHRSKFVEDNERLIVIIGLSLTYILFIVFFIVFFRNMNEKHRLEMKFESEKSFNSVYMAINESMVRARTAMEQEGVIGIGIYSSRGNAYQRIGNAPEKLPISAIAKSRQGTKDSTLGVYVFNNSDNTIEYLRLSRFSVMLSTGTMNYSNSGNALPVSADFPEIIYVKFDGTAYFRHVSRTIVLFAVSVIFVSAMFVIILAVYENNRKTRIQLAKNQNLVNLGSAARTLTHEIKNPLSAMTIQTAILKKTLPKEYVSDVDVIDEEIQRLTSLTNRVSEFLKNPQGNPQNIELVSFVQKIASLFSAKIPVLSECENNVFINFDPDLARSVFENLIKNATESALNRNPEVSVVIKSPRRHMVTISILDRGDGLQGKSKDNIFDPFYTTKIHGSGIGLAISKQFVTAAKGYLKLSARDGGGTVATVVLPCYEVEM